MRSIYVGYFRLVCSLYTICSFLLGSYRYKENSVRAHSNTIIGEILIAIGVACIREFDSILLVFYDDSPKMSLDLFVLYIGICKSKFSQKFVEKLVMLNKRVLATTRLNLFQKKKLYIIFLLYLGNISSISTYK